MPRGLSKIRQIAAEAQARQKAYEEAGPGIRFFSLDDGQSAKVRFLEQGDEVWYVWTHQLPKQPGQRFGDSVMCLDQEDQGNPCPGCARGKTRTARIVINVIWYGAPKFKRDKDNKLLKGPDNKPILDGVEDCVAVWNASQTVGGRLDHLHEKNNGLLTHIFEVTRQGTEKQTSYMIDLVDKDKEPMAAEVELYKAKGDPRKAIRQLGFGDMERAYSGGGIATGAQPGLGEPQPDADMSNNVFAKAAAGGVVNRGAFGG